MSEMLYRGPVWGMKGGAVPFTSQISGAQRVADAHARYMQAATEDGGRMYLLDSDSITLAAANATKSALGTIKLINGIWNPPGSNKNAVIVAAHIATVSGTPAGPFFWNYRFVTQLTNAPTGSIRNCLLNQAASGSAMLAQVNVVLTVNPADTAALIQLGLMGGPSAVAATGALSDAYEEVAGRIVVPPGCVFGLTATGAGTSHIVQSTLVWEEVPALQA